MITAIYRGGTYAPGGSLDASIIAMNLSRGDIPEGQSFNMEARLSLDGAWDQSDVLVYTGTVANGVDPYELLRNTWTLQIPGDTPEASYRLLVKLDVDEEIAEQNEANNLWVSPLANIKVAISSAPSLPPPDLRLLAVLYRPGTYEPDSFVDATGLLMNLSRGPVPAGTAFTVEARLSLDKVWDNDDISVFAGVVDTGMRPFELRRDAVEIYLPDQTPDGAYHLLVKADALNEISEANETNNLWVSPVANFKIGTVPLTPGLRPDLNIAGAVYLPGSYDAGEDLTVLGTLANLGRGGVPEWEVFDITARLSLNKQLGDADDVVVFMDSIDGIGPLERGSEWVDMWIPDDTPAGYYYLAVQADPDNVIQESNETNNVWWSPTANIRVLNSIL
jgi:hypothetical protein